MASKNIPKNANRPRLLTYGGSASKKSRTSNGATRCRSSHGERPHVVTGSVPDRVDEFAQDATFRQTIVAPSHRPSVQSNSSRKALQSSLGLDRDAYRKRKRSTTFASKASAGPEHLDESYSSRGGLGLREDGKHARTTQDPSVPSMYSNSEKKSNDRNIYSKPGASKLLQVGAPRRRRLIDTLAAQRAETPDSDYDSPDMKQEIDPLESTKPTSLLLAENIEAPYIRKPEPRTRLSTSKKIKMTYSHARINKINHDADKAVDHGHSAAFEADQPDANIYSAPSSPQAQFEDSEDDTTSKVGIRSVHELRRAGANNRFSDELDDLLTRIERKSSSSTLLRRNAVCELLVKLQERDFASQFRDHASRDKIAKHIGHEEDIISGYALIAIFTVFLSSTPAPHLLHQLVSEGVGKLLSYMLQFSEDVLTVATRKQLSITKQAKTCLESARIFLLSMPIWLGVPIKSISPRTLALRLLEVLGRCLEPQLSKEIWSDVITNMVAVADDCIQDTSETNIDYVIMVYALEAQSSYISSKYGAYCHIAKQTLRHTLQHWPSKSLRQDGLVFKYVINVTNNEKSAVGFEDEKLLVALSASIIEGLRILKDAVNKDRLQGDLYNELLLLLGIMINLLEHCSASRGLLDEDSLNMITEIWIKNVSLSHEADSVGKSKMNVAFGYLSIVLGYLHLDSSNYARLKQNNAWPGTTHLITAMQDFLGVHRSIDTKMYEVELLIQDLRRQQGK